MNDLLSNPALIGLVVAIPSFILGLLAYKRSVNVDRTTAQSQADTNEIGAVNQVIDGLNKLVSNLQEDNRLLRLGIDDLKKQLRIAIKKIDTLSQEIRSLRNIK